VRKTLVSLLSLLFIPLLAAGCTSPVKPVAAPSQTPVLIQIPTETTESAAVVSPIPPPSLEPSHALISTSVAVGVIETPRPTPTPDCRDDLRFVADLTIPDGTVVSPAEQIDKRWQVKNNGTCNWDDRYRLHLVAGPAMGASKVQALFPALSGSQAVVRILFTAPNDLGTYRSAWQAVDPQGNSYGDPVYIDIIVAGTGP